MLWDTYFSSRDVPPYPSGIGKKIIVLIRFLSTMFFLYDAATFPRKRPGTICLIRAVNVFSHFLLLLFSVCFIVAFSPILVSMFSSENRKQRVVIVESVRLRLMYKCSTPPSPDTTKFVLCLKFSVYDPKRFLKTIDYYSDSAVYWKGK